MSKEIQKILDAQKEISPMKDMTPAQINKRIGHAHAVENRRKIPLKDCELIIREYYCIDQIRPVGFIHTIAERYDVKVNIIEKILNNARGTMDPVEHQQLKDAYNAKYTRSDLLKQIHAENKRDAVAAGDSISKAKQSISDEDANDIYNRCLPWKNKRGAKAFQEELAKEYGVSAYKIKITSYGEHPALDGSRDGVKR